MVALGLLALAGCQPDLRSPGEHDDQAGHVIPAHKPKDFSSGVRRLRELNDRIASGIADGKARSLVADKTLPMALDIAHWLPEIAAASDMPESPWNEVNDRSEALVSAYETLLEAATGDDRPAGAAAMATEAGATIGALETLLEAANPLWFAPYNPGGVR